MAVKVVTNGKYVGKAPNDSNSFVIHFHMLDTAATSDTLECTIPDHTDKDAIPLAAVCMSRAVTGVVTHKPVTITSHQVAPNSGQTAAETVGTTILTVGASALAIGDIVQIKYSAVKFTAP